MTQDISFSLSVPGKIILVGEHSVLYDKQGVAVSINKRTNLTFKERKQAHHQLTVNFQDLKRVTVWDFKNVYDFINRDKPLKCELNEFSISKPELLDHDNYVAIIREFVDHKSEDLNSDVRNALMGLFYIVGSMLWCSNVDLCPFDIEVKSDLAMGAGTGSSAAYAVCVSSAFYYYLKLKALNEDGTDRHNICNGRFQPHYIDAQLATALTDEDRQCINKWAYCIEKIMHGKPSGLDNTVCTFGSAILINASESSKGSPDLQPTEDIPPIRILLINTGIERQTLQLVKQVRDLKELIPEVVDSVLTSLDIVAVSFIKILRDIKIANQPEVNSLYRKLEGLVDISQGLLVTLGVSHFRLDEICYITKRRGLHSKLTGAGGGGNAFTIIPPDVEESTVNAVMSDLKSSGFTVDYISVGSPGLTIDSNSTP